MIKAKEIEWGKTPKGMNPPTNVTYGWIAMHVLAKIQKLPNGVYSCYFFVPYEDALHTHTSDMQLAKQWCQDQLNNFVNQIAEQA